MTITFAPCPTYPGYQASACGAIRRAERPSIRAGKEGATLPAKVHKPITARPAFVNLNGALGWVRIADMVADAWPQYDADELDAMGRPRSWYPDGRVVTLAEWIAELWIISNNQPLPP